MKRTITAIVLTVAALAVAMPAQAKVAPTGLGHTLTGAEFRSYRCGHWRETRPVRAFLVHRTRWRIIPANQLTHRKGIKARCGYARPHTYPVPRPVIRPKPTTPPVVPAPAVPAATPAVPAKAYECRTEIGPVRAAATSGLAINASVDPYDPAPYDVGDINETWNSGKLTVDDAGHVRSNYGGQAFVNPVASAQYGLAALTEYRHHGDTAWLGRAETAAGDALGTATPDNLFPYDLPWMGPDGSYFDTPAYSAMAQGQMLSLTVRLAEATGDPTWRDQADRLFATLDKPGTSQHDVTFVDTDGYLWFEEYSMQCPGRVLNGHMFATFGVLDYYLATGDPEAGRLFDAAATTVLHYLPQIRRPGKASFYGVSQQVVHAFYHPVHVAQLRTLGAATGDPRFDQWADLLHADHA